MEGHSNYTMSRIPQIRIKIGSDAIKNMETDLKFYLMESTDILTPPQREYETEVFPESSGVSIYPVTSDEQFDYNIKLCYFGSEDSANLAISAFNTSLFTKIGDLKTAKELTIYNDFKRVMVVGYVKSIKTDTTNSIKSRDVVIFDFLVQVTNPNKCNFNL